MPKKQKRKREKQTRDVRNTCDSNCIRLKKHLEQDVLKKRGHNHRYISLKFLGHPFLYDAIKWPHIALSYVIDKSLNNSATKGQMCKIRERDKENALVAIQRKMWLILRKGIMWNLTSFYHYCLGWPGALIHYVKSVRIPSFSGLYLPALGLNTERYGVSLRIKSECGKIRTRKTPNTDNFYAVIANLLAMLQTHKDDKIRWILYTCASFLCKNKAWSTWRFQ